MAAQLLVEKSPSQDSRLEDEDEAVGEAKETAAIVA